jgi:hypothetical protein
MYVYLPLHLIFLLLSTPFSSPTAASNLASRLDVCVRNATVDVYRVTHMYTQPHWYVSVTNATTALMKVVVLYVVIVEYQMRTIAESVRYWRKTGMAAPKL